MLLFNGIRMMARKVGLGFVAMLAVPFMISPGLWARKKSWRNGQIFLAPVEQSIPWPR